MSHIGLAMGIAKYGSQSLPCHKIHTPIMGPAEMNCDILQRKHITPGGGQRVVFTSPKRIHVWQSRSCRLWSCAQRHPDVLHTRRTSAMWMPRFFGVGELPTRRLLHDVDRCGSWSKCSLILRISGQITRVAKSRINIMTYHDQSIYIHMWVWLGDHCVFISSSISIHQEIWWDFIVGYCWDDATHHHWGWGQCEIVAPTGSPFHHVGTWWNLDSHSSRLLPSIGKLSYIYNIVCVCFTIIIILLSL